jgi:hypothetical protein
LLIAVSHIHFFDVQIGNSGRHRLLVDCVFLTLKLKEMLPKKLPTPVEPASDRAHGAAHVLRYLFITVPLHIGEHYGPAIVSWQGRESAPYSTARLSAQKRLFRH